MKDKFKEGMHIHEIGLGPAWGPLYGGFPVKDFRQIVEELGITHLDVLKIDVEGIELYSESNSTGSEFTALDFVDTDWFRSLGVTQVLLEIHYFRAWGLKEDSVAKIMKLFDNSGYYPFSK
jgi:hypothetical protein